VSRDTFVLTMNPLQDMMAQAQGPMVFAVAIGIGLFSSLTHCAGMCAPIHFFLAARGGVAVYAYHFGRIVTYIILGTLAGGLGHGLWHAPASTLSRIGASTLALVYALMALHWFGVLPWAVWIEKGLKPLATLARKGMRLDHVTPTQTSDSVSDMGRTFGFLGAGLAGGLLPCPTTQAGLLLAIGLGHASAGALAMALLGLGTLPVFVALRPAWAKRLSQGPRRFARAYGITLGLVFFALAIAKVHGAWFAAAPRCH
jgi:uncharacterized protein